jgi:hypothetical protein
MASWRRFARSHTSVPTDLREFWRACCMSRSSYTSAFNASSTSELKLSDESDEISKGGVGATGGERNRVAVGGAPRAAALDGPTLLSCSCGIIANHLGDPADCGGALAQRCVSDAPTTSPTRTQGRRKHRDVAQCHSRYGRN